jgi:hypothetical protein
MKTKQTTLILPEQLLKDFKKYAKSQAKSVTALVREFMEKQLKKVNNEQ